MKPTVLLGLWRKKKSKFNLDSERGKKSKFNLDSEKKKEKISVSFSNNYYHDGKCFSVNSNEEDNNNPLCGTDLSNKIRTSTYHALASLIYCHVLFPARSEN